MEWIRPGDLIEGYNNSWNAIDKWIYLGEYRALKKGRLIEIERMSPLGRYIMGGIPEYWEFKVVRGERKKC